MLFKKGDKVSQYRMNKLMTGQTQKMWQLKDEIAGWKQVALTTLFDGGQSEILSSINMDQYQLCMARSETQQIRWIWDSKREIFVKFTCIPRLDLAVKKEKVTPPPAPTPEPVSAEAEKGDE